MTNSTHQKNDPKYADTGTPSDSNQQVPTVRANPSTWTCSVQISNWPHTTKRTRTCRLLVAKWPQSVIECVLPCLNMPLKLGIGCLPSYYFAERYADVPQTGQSLSLHIIHYTRMVEGQWSSRATFWLASPSPSLNFTWNLDIKSCDILC